MGCDFAAFEMVVTKKLLQESTINNDLFEKILWRKNNASIRVLHLSIRVPNKPDVQWPTLSKFLNIAGIFWSYFLLDTAYMSKEDFLSNAGMFLVVVLWPEIQFYEV